MGWLHDAVKKLPEGTKDMIGGLVDFVKDPVDDFENLGEELRRWRDNVLNLNPAGVSEELWGEAGRFGYTAAAAIMAKRSPTGKPISSEYRSALYPFFGETVHKVTLHWSTPPLNEWVADKFKVSLENTDTVAQTFGYDIYIKYREGENSPYEELELLAHELIHTQQFEKHDRSYSKFGYHYFKEYKKANLSYKNNKLEREAYEQVERIISSVYDHWQKVQEPNKGDEGVPPSISRWLEPVLHLMMS